MTPADPGKRMIARIKLAYESGKTVLWISQMSGFSTQRVMEIVQQTRRKLKGGKGTGL